MEVGQKMQRKKITLHTLKEMHARKEPIVMLTCYDYPMAMYANVKVIQKSTQ